MGFNITSVILLSQSLVSARVSLWSHRSVVTNLPEYFLWLWYFGFNLFLLTFRSSHPKVFLGKGVLRICSKFTGEHPCRSAISIKLLSNFIEITLWHGCAPVNLLHIFRTTFLKNTSGWLLSKYVKKIFPSFFNKVGDLRSGTLLKKNLAWVFFISTLRNF